MPKFFVPLLLPQRVYVFSSRAQLTRSYDAFPTHPDNDPTYQDLLYYPMKREAKVALEDLDGRVSTCSVKRAKTCPRLHSTNAPPPPMTVTFRDREYNLTPSFDTFWRLAAERHSIEEKRRAGHPPPWSSDQILTGHKFCNTFRVLDRVSQYIVSEVIEKGPQDREEVTFRVVLFSTYTSIRTYETLRNKIQPLTWKTYKRANYENVLRDLYDRGITIYTGAYQKPAPLLGFTENFMNHLAFLEVLMQELPNQLRDAKYIADVFEFLREFKSMGDFTAYQLLLNLSYSNVMNFSDHDFVVLGLGARRGLQRCLQETVPRAIEVDIVRWMQVTQDAHFARLGLKFNGLGPDRLPMMLCDIEHTLCEVDKYIRKCAQKTSSNRQFESDRKLGKLRLPKAWAHKSRNVLRIKSQEEAEAEVLEKFIVEYIKEHRVVKGEREFYVLWEGYAEDEATWEPEDSLMEDAPDAVRQYLKTIKIEVKAE